MLSVPVYNLQGKQQGQVEIDPAVLGGEIRTALLKQAIVAFQDHQRQDSARTKSRADVVGSTKKLYRQKGTGNARAGNSRTPVRRGGGRTFAKRGPRRRLSLSKKMRRAARDSAVLAKIQSEDAMIIEGLEFAEPKTKAFAAMVSALGADRGCMLATDEFDRNVLLSSRNIKKVDVRRVEELNAYEVLLRRKLIFTKEAFAKLSEDAA